jgi:hypothetical protein
VLYPDGEVATFNKADSTWTIVNNKGKRQHFQDGVMRDISAIPCAFETDPETKCVTMIREDDVVCVHYPDGSRFVQHADGTQMFTKDNEIRIEKTGFASHCIKHFSPEDQEKDIRAGGPFFRKLDPELVKKPEERALDGRILETYLPDGSVSQTFFDSVAAGEEYENRWRHLIKRTDLSVVVVDSAGCISLINSNARAALCESGSKVKLDHSDNDRDYLAELSRNTGSFTPGVYQAVISAEEGKPSCIMTKNYLDDNLFILRNDNTLVKRSASMMNADGVLSGSHSLRGSGSKLS